ncbi:uncharacterized protein TNCV_5065311 [Trichonephila clavipes]|nr:uncharacterized protein TNCV_5065311 [Trichonephila clavipes]
MSEQRFLKLDEALELLNSLDSDEREIKITVLPPDASELTDEEEKWKRMNYYLNTCGQDYWSDAEDLENPMVKNAMSRNYFQKLKSYSHFVINGTVNQPAQDRSCKISGRELPDRTNHDFSFIITKVKSVKSVFQARAISPPYTTCHTRAGVGGIMLWGTFLWMTMGSLVVVEEIVKAVDNLSIIAYHLLPYVASVFRTSIGIFQPDNAPCPKARIVLERFQMNIN